MVADSDTSLDLEVVNWGDYLKEQDCSRVLISEFLLPSLFVGS